MRAAETGSQPTSHSPNKRLLGIGAAQSAGGVGLDLGEPGEKSPPTTQESWSRGADGTEVGTSWSTIHLTTKCELGRQATFKVSGQDFFDQIQDSAANAGNPASSMPWLKSNTEKMQPIPLTQIFRAGKTKSFPRP